MREPRRPRFEWAIVVHGGAKAIPDAAAPSYRTGCERAATVGSEVLAAGGAAVDAVVAAILVLENDPTFNAGTGAVENSAGYSELDAAIMDGRRLDVGAVAAMRGGRNPILAAHAMLGFEETLLVAEGARAFARTYAPEALDAGEPPPPTSSGGDTVGCVAIDDEGNIAAGTSTGGLDDTRPGRVGDSPIPGAGFYAENGVGGVAISGEGERISRVTLAAWAMSELRHRNAADAARSSISRLEIVEGEGGIILMDKAGRIGWAYNSAEFAVAFATADHPVDSFTSSDVNEPPE